MRFLHALKRAVIVCVRSFLALFYFLPVHDGRILLSSYVGEQYSGNVRRMSEYLLAHYGEEVELIWEFRHPEKFRDIRHQNGQVLFSRLVLLRADELRVPDEYGSDQNIPETERTACDEHLAWRGSL